MYLLINHADGYVEEIAVIEYLIFDSTDDNKELKNKKIHRCLERNQKQNQRSK